MKQENQYLLCKENLFKQPSLEELGHCTATIDDVDYCNDICQQIHGHDRNGEIIDSIKQGSAKVIIHLGKISGYTCGLDFFNHSVGMTNDDS